MAKIDFTAATLVLLTFTDGHSVALPSSETSEYIRSQRMAGHALIHSNIIL